MCWSRDGNLLSQYYIKEFDDQGVMHTVGVLTDCDTGEVDTHTTRIPENEGKERINNNHDSSMQIMLAHETMTFDTLSNLPLNVLECIVGYLSVIDTLITCYTSPLLNEHISLLHDSWKEKWKRICFTNNKEALRPVVNWKAECERELALLLKFPEYSMFSNPEGLYLRVSVTSMDYCDGTLLCFGEARATMKIYAYLYQYCKHSWKSIVTFPVPGHPISITYSCLVPGYKIFAGRNDGNLFVWNLDMATHQVTLKTLVRAHSDAINHICPNQELAMVTTTGKDNALRFWNLNSQNGELAVFFIPGVFEAKILTGDKSPFTRYNCVLVTTREEPVGYSVAMGCWGDKIPVNEAIFARKVCHTEKYDFGWSRSFIIPSVFVQGGSLVYGLELIDHSQRRVFKMVWQPLEPEDFVSSGGSKSNEELDRFRSSLRPWRKSCVIPLPEKTTHIFGVGKHFSVCVTKYKHKSSQNLTLVVNETGDTENLLPPWTRYYKFGFGIDPPSKMVCSKWLDGLDYIKAGSISLILNTDDDGFMIFTWRKDVFEYNKPALSKLLALREARGGLTASLV